jgi:peptidoglycan/LPS O-acetylase OafA/YrhL
MSTYLRQRPAPRHAAPPGWQRRWQRHRAVAPRLASAYVPALDGVRALAVAAVVTFHGGVHWARGGFLGVDAFFVLSGYLITTLLLAERRRTGRIALRAFWGRRARRLLPALCVVIVAVTVCARSMLSSSEVRLLRGDGLAALFYVGNWRMMLRGGDYFAQTAAPSPLQHMWSLGIEEQFYLLWPILLILFLGGRGRVRLRLLLVACVAGALGSTMTLALVYRPDDAGRAYYGTDTRAASLLIGAALAVLLELRRPAPRPAPRPVRKRRPLLGCLALAGATGTGWAWTHLDGADTHLYHGGLLLSALAVAAVLAHVALAPGGLSARLLSLPPLPALGRISYGVYLWHWPIFLAANAYRTGLHGFPLFAVRCTATICAATLSYVLVERPIRSATLLRYPRIARPVTASAVACCLVLLLAVTAVPGLPPGDPAAGDPAAGPTARALSLALSGRTAPDDQPSGGSGPAAAWLPHHRQQDRPTVVDVFGDSMAWAMAAYLPPTPGIEVHNRAIVGCGVTRTVPFRYFGQTYRTVSATCQDWPGHYQRAIQADNPDVVLLLVGRWETMDRVLDGRWQHVGEPAFDAELRSALALAISIAGSQGAHVVLATEPYNRRGEQPDGSIYPEDQPRRVDDWNRLLRDVASRLPRTSIVDLHTRVCPAGRFTMSAGGVRVREDGVHFTRDGVERWIAPWLLPQLTAAVPP